MPIWNRIRLVPYSGTYIRTLFYSKPEIGMHMTEMMTFHCSLFIFVISCKYGVNSLVVIYLFAIIHHLRHFQPCIFSVPEIFIPDVHGMKNRRQKMESIYGAYFWSMCHGFYVVCCCILLAIVSVYVTFCNILVCIWSPLQFMVKCFKNACERLWDMLFAWC